MAKIIAIHSFRGGTGKSTITSNLAAYLASLGNRVLIIDTDIKSPGVHAIFGLHEDSLQCTFNDYLTGDCTAEEIVYDVSEQAKLKQGNLFLTPSSIEYGDIANTLISKYSYKLLKKAFDELIEKFKLDYLIVDTHPGINEETLLAAEMSDAFLIIVRPDNQDYQGAKVSTEIAKKLNINSYIILNKVHAKMNKKEIVKYVEDVFGFPVIGTIPFSEDVLLSESKHVFYKKKPRHPFSKEIKKIISEVLIRKPSKTLQKS